MDNKKAIKSIGFRDAVIYDYNNFVIEWALEELALPCLPIDRHISLQMSYLQRVYRLGLWDLCTLGSSPTLFVCSPAAICC